MIAPPLNQRNLKDYLPFVRTITERLIEKWGSATTPTVAINQDLMSYTIDIIGLIAFDRDIDCLRKTFSQDAEDLKVVFQTMFVRAVAPFSYYKIPIIGPYLDLGEFSAGRVQRFVQGIIHSFQTESNSSKGNRDQTYLHKVLNQPDLSHERIMGNLLTMFAAGSETTGNTVMICLWELLQADQKNNLQELVEEVQTFSNLEEASFDELFKGLPKVRAFFYEINRLKGTVPGLYLENPEPVTLGGIVIPAHTEVYLDCAYLGTLEGSGIPDGPNGEPAAEFCPRRWLTQQPGTGELTVTKPCPQNGISFSSGFGGGVRICPGQDLAELEVVYCLASLLKQFEIQLKAGHEPVKLRASFTESPNIDIELVLKKR